MSGTKRATNPREVAGWIYVLSHPESSGRIKIGFSGKEPEGEGGRVRDLTFLIRAFELGKVDVFRRERPYARTIEKAVQSFRVDESRAARDESFKTRGRCLRLHTAEPYRLPPAGARQRRNGP